VLVYGDHERTLEAQALVDRIATLLRDAAGIGRHDMLVSALIDAGLLLQGIADHEFSERGADGPSPAQDAAGALLSALAAKVWASWNGSPDRAEVPLQRTIAAAPREPLRCRVPEGFAHYAVYPEAYAAAAPGRFAVVGIRSIGTTLAAMVAARGGSAPAVTVRPVGPPFERRIALDPGAAARLVRSPDPIAIVDEGPGLSGSSFGGVADFLEARGAAPGRLHFFPSHDGEPGPQAQPHHRARWRASHRHRVGFEALLLDGAAPGHRLDRRFADLVGRPLLPLEDVSGGGWRARRTGPWPPVHRWQERRKYLLRTSAGTFLLKFVGLGRFGEKAFARAQALHAAGFGNRPIGYRHGFLIEPWHDAARPPRREGEERRLLLDVLGKYLLFRARRFPADASDGADIPALLAMARTNVEESLGRTMAERLSRISPPAGRLRRIETDNRMQAWEWLLLPDGRLLKADGLDHHAGHDLVGCQDVAWDVAGAAVELDLTSAETLRLAQMLGVDDASLAFHGACYLAFQLGAAEMAIAAHADAPDERARWRVRADGLKGRLLGMLEAR
jgi:hypothetical protein